MPKIKFCAPDNAIHNLAEPLKTAVVAAQESVFAANFANAKVFIDTVFNQLQISCEAQADLASIDATDFSDKSFADFTKFFTNLLATKSYPTQSIHHTASTLATRAMLLRAFNDPDAAVAYVQKKVIEVVSTFPQTGSDIEVGRNKGDVLDPFIIAATQYLLYQGEFPGAVSATVSHKAIMIIEGMLGHLHEDVLGLMRGNVRIPEPRGEDQESFDQVNLPFPGADLIQPPAAEGEQLRIHQIKSKTGSAKGGDGKRLGDQLQFLADHYSADIFYDALVGNTLSGHRSKAGVEKAAPSVTVLVGQAAFRQLTGSSHGASLLLKLYQEAFHAAARETGYSISEVTTRIVDYFEAKSADIGEDFLDSILETSTGGSVEDQDSRIFNTIRERAEEEALAIKAAKAKEKEEKALAKAAAKASKSREVKKSRKKK